MTPNLTPQVARAHPNRTLGILVLGAIAYALAQTMIIPALPAIQEEVGASPEAATWLLTAFLLTSSVSTPLLGRLGDMYGKEKILLAVLGVFALGSLVARSATRSASSSSGAPSRARAARSSRSPSGSSATSSRASAWPPRSA